MGRIEQDYDASDSDSVMEFIGVKLRRTIAANPSASSIYFSYDGLAATGIDFLIEYNSALIYLPDLYTMGKQFQGLGQEQAPTRASSRRALTAVSHDALSTASHFGAQLHR